MPINPALLEALLKKSLPDVPELAGTGIQPPPDSAAGSVPTPQYQIGAQMPSPPQMMGPMPEDPRLTALYGQQAQLDAPQKPTLLGTLTNAARGLTPMDPAQFQQNERLRYGQEFSDRQTQKQNVAAQIRQILDKQHQDTDDQRQQEMLRLAQNQDQRQATAAPVALAHTAAETNRLNTPEFGEIGPGGTVYDKTTGAPKFTSGAASKSLQTKEIQDPQNPKQPLQANFDPASGKTTDPRTGQEIPNPTPYQKPADPGVASDRKIARGDRSYQFNSAALEKVAGPVGDSIQRFGRLKDTIDTGSPMADALTAPELMVVMAGGQGSGVRITQGEINSVLGGQSKWEQMKAALQQWSTDPAKANKILEPMRGQIHTLLDTVNTKLTAKQQVIEEARDALDNSDDPQEHRKIVSEAKKKLAAIDSGSTGHPPAAGFTANVGDKTYTFPDQQSLDAFKKEAGIP